MKRVGHYGVALALYSPIGAGLLVSGLEILAVVGLASVLALTTFPDVDHLLPGIPHRGGTHTLVFALATGVATGATAVALAGDASDTALADATGADPTLATGGFWFAVGFVAICAHLLGDLLTPKGISPFWPLSTRRYSLRLVRADNLLANYSLFAIGLLIAGVTLLVLLG